MKKLLIALLILVLLLAACTTQVPEEHQQLREQNAALQQQLEQYREWQEWMREQFGDPVTTAGSCGLTFIEIMEREQQLALVIQVCRMSPVQGFSADQPEHPRDWPEHAWAPQCSLPAEELPNYFILLTSVGHKGVSTGTNPLFAHLFCPLALHPLNRVPAHLESANLQFHWQGLDSATYQIMVFSDYPIGIDENHIDTDTLPLCWRGDPYHPNTGPIGHNFRFVIPIWIGESP